MNKKKLIAILIVVVSIAVGVVGYIILPATVTIQINLSGGAGNTAAKEIALVLPFAISGLGAAYYSKEGKTSHLIAALIGLVIYIPLFLLNL